MSDGERVRVSLEVVSRAADRVELAATVENRSGEAVYLWDGRRMPYVLVDGASAVRLARSLPPLPEGASLYGVEIPSTTTLAPGETRREAITLALPLQASSHFEKPHAPAVAPRGRVELRLEVGLAPQPIAPGTRSPIGYGELVRRQVVVRSEPVVLDIQ